MKRTIEDLKVNRTFYHRYRDSFGNRVNEPYEKPIKREVKVVKEWLRFGHYLIDAIILGLLNFCLDLLWVQSSSYDSFAGINSYSYNLIPALDNIIVMVGYYFICEYTMQRTIGKFATNSVVINQYAEAPAPESLLGRSFARLVPFEALSCLSNRGWHDKWSKTYVVTTTERDNLKKLLYDQDEVFISDSKDLLD
ncbi:MAG: RDD family protein [Crocinitomicaceae bacterium]|nr:RDD family protein [Crocinitomicaceae bacterium]